MGLVTWPMNAGEAGGDTDLCFSHLNANCLALVQRDLRNKSSEVLMG